MLLNNIKPFRAITLLILCQRYNLKANHNSGPFLPSVLLLLILCQRYNLKANHNMIPEDKKQDIVVDSMSKIQSESKSQQLGYEGYGIFCC